MKKKRKIMLCGIMTLIMALVMAMSISASAAEEGTVATVGDNEYETVQDAVNAVSNGHVTGTIDVVSDTTENIAIPVKSTIVLNILDGVTISGGNIKDTAGKSHTIINDGTLTVMGTGVIENANSGSGALFNNANATANLNGGTFTGTTWYVIKNLGTITIDGAAVTQEDAGSSAIDNGWYGNASNDCSVAYPGDGYTADLTILNGTFSGGMNIVKNDDYGVLDIRNGTFTNTDGPTVLNWNEASISGGNFTVNSNASSVIANGYLNGSGDKGQFTISGGTFTASNDGTGALFGYGVGSQAGGSFTITNGSFNGSVETSDDYPYTPVISGGSFSAEPTAYTAEAAIVVGYTPNGNSGIMAYYVGDQEQINGFLNDSEAGDKVLVIKGENVVLNIPSAGVSVENSTTVPITVNGVEVAAAGSTITEEQGASEQPTKPTSPADETTVASTEKATATGDDFNMTALLAVMGLAAAAAAGTVIYGRRKRSN